MSYVIVPNVNSRKEYMEQLESMMSRGTTEEHEYTRPGRRTELKTYLIESNSLMSQEFLTPRFSVTMRDTGVKDLKIIHLLPQGAKSYDAKKAGSFYLDMSDKRFWLLHTHGLAEHVDDMVEDLITSHSHQFDSAWFSTGMLKQVSQRTGNKFDGAGIDYEPLFTAEEEPEVPMEELKINAFGFRAIEALKNMSEDEAVKNYFAYKKVRIVRGGREGYAKDDVHFSGRFSVKSGKSIDDHIALVDGARMLYRDEMKIIEDQGLGVRKQHDSYIVEGKPFEFILDKPITNWDNFLNIFLKPTSPFRLWGIKKQISMDYYQILAVDLHTGHSLDIEISNNLLRVYLPKGSCGNCVLRLFVNLQHFVDSKILCEEIPQT